MKTKTSLKLFFIAITSINFQLLAQVPAKYCTNNDRFTDAYYFDEDKIIVESEIKFAKTNHIYCKEVEETEILRFNIYYPKSGKKVDGEDPLAERPFVMMIFGGGFVSGNKNSCNNYCMELARRGFVAATIDYRTGKDTIYKATPDSKLNCRCYVNAKRSDFENSQEKAAYKALQDAHAAMRYFVANAQTYKIDVNALFVGGYSAGAATALSLVYATQDEATATYSTIVDELGDINSSGNPLTNTFKIKGVFNNWGGVSSDYYDDNESVPIVSFHGANDEVVPILSAQNETCDGITPYFVYGSGELSNRLYNSTPRVCSNLTVKKGGDHGVWGGTPDLGYRVGRAACFFKSLFCNNCSSSYTLINTLTPANCSSVSVNRQLYTNTLENSNTQLLPNMLDEKLMRNTSITLNEQYNLPVKVYPIPAKEMLNIQFPNNHFTVNIATIYGQLKYSAKGVDSNLELDVSTWPRGIYYLKLTSNTGAVYNTSIFVTD